MGFPGNVGDPVASGLRDGPGEPFQNLPAHGEPCSATGGNEQAGTRRYHQAKETKRGGTCGRKSERPSSTGEGGEPTRGTHWREGGRRALDPKEGTIKGH